jgi:hypothetical protein
MSPRTTLAAVIKEVILVYDFSRWLDGSPDMALEDSLWIFITIRGIDILSALSTLRDVILEAGYESKFE